MKSVPIITYSIISYVLCKEHVDVTFYLYTNMHYYDVSNAFVHTVCRVK
jgi:hypothetical protein